MPSARNKKSSFSGLVNRLMGTKSGSSTRTGHVRMDVSRITDQIYVGTNACCQSHYTAMLIRQGVAHDISLEGEHVDAPYGVESYLWLPTPDHTAPTKTGFRIGLSYIDTVIKNAGKVFIHCTNGHGRAPTMAAAWFVSQGMSVNDAIRTLKKGRPEIHIEPEQKKALQWCFKTLRG